MKTMSIHAEQYPVYPMKAMVLLTGLHSPSELIRSLLELLVYRLVSSQNHPWQG